MLPTETEGPVHGVERNAGHGVEGVAESATTGPNLHEYESR